MAKDWAPHKAVVERLYIDEGKTLKEVQEILSVRFGFKASIRAYRMRIDEWALRKYKMRQDHSSGDTGVEPIFTPTEEPSPRNPTPPPSSSTNVGNMLQSGLDPTTLIEKLNADDVWALIQSRSTSYPLEFLLTKWQPGGKFLGLLATLLQNPMYCKEIYHRADDGRPLLFKLIEENVPGEERLNVGKLLLEVQFSACHIDKSHEAEWLLAWITACHYAECDDWEDAKDALNDNSKVSLTAGDLFLDCALAVIAEHLLKHHMTEFRKLKERTGWLYKSEMTASEECRQKYLRILEECLCGDLYLQPSFYKISLEIVEARNSSMEDNIGTRCSDLADSCRHKYIQLTCGSKDSKQNGYGDDGSFGGNEESDWNDGRDINNHSVPQDTASSGDRNRMPSLNSLLTNTEPLGGSTSKRSEPPRQSDYSTSMGNNNPSKAYTAVQTLMEKWRSLRGFTAYVHSILEGDTPDIFIFELASDGTENLFDMIHMHIPSADQISLTKAILVAFSTVNLNVCWRPYSLTWFLSLYNSPSWKSFQSSFTEEKISTYLTPVMSPAAVKLVLDATILLVGERLLGILKEEMVNNPGYKARGGEALRYHDTFQEYMAILKAIQERDLYVDRGWLGVALNTM